MRCPHDAPCSFRQSRIAREQDARRSLREKRCGAKTRKGPPCQAPAVWSKAKGQPVNGRCRMHGGLSTGPKTPEGKVRALAALELGRKIAGENRRKSAAKKSQSEG